jgi:hypothetical protein
MSSRDGVEEMMRDAKKIQNYIPCKYLVTTFQRGK